VNATVGTKETVMSGTALQDLFLPNNVCFGCGVDHPDGLQLKSYVEADGLVAQWIPSESFQGPPGVVNGGVMAIPLDCHGTWTAMHAFTDPGSSVFSGAVTAGYSVALTAPTPIGALVHLRSWVTDLQGRKAKITVRATIDGAQVAEFTGTFVRVAPFTYPDPSGDELPHGREQGYGDHDGPQQS
jgi:acyl-coenzyme A thioesterase PaaI-like protein